MLGRLVFVLTILSLPICAGAYETKWVDLNDNEWYFSNSHVTNDIIGAADSCQNIAPAGSWSVPFKDDLKNDLVTDFEAGLLIPNHSREKLGLWDVDLVIVDKSIDSDGWAINSSHWSSYHGGRSLRFFPLEIDADEFSQGGSPDPKPWADARFATLCVKRSNDAPNASATRELFFSVIHNSLERAKAALAKGADPTNQILRRSPRSLALELLRPSMIQFFGTSGFYADKPAKDFQEFFDSLETQSSTPFSYLLRNRVYCYSGDFEVCRLVDKERPNFQAAVAAMKPFVEDLNQPCSVGGPLGNLNYIDLIQAYGLETARIMLSLGLNPDMPTAEYGNYCALYTAVERRDVSLTQLLIASKANPKCSQIANHKTPISDIDESDRLEASNPQSFHDPHIQAMADVLCQVGERAGVCLHGIRQNLVIEVYTENTPVSRIGVSLKLKTKPDLEPYFKADTHLELYDGEAHVRGTLLGRANSTYELTVSAPGMRTQVFDIQSGPKVNEEKSIRIKFIPN